MSKNFNLFFVVLTMIFSSTSRSEAQAPSKAEISKWTKQAQQVSIIRDHWGIPHIYGKTDADAVFGLLYAQCEDDFKRVEMNYVEKLGRTAEVLGSAAIYEDLLNRMIIDTAAAEKDYNHAPVWMKKLCNAFADGINYYLYKHPEVKPALLRRFKPWYPMLWTDGSIGAIQTADLTFEELKSFYTGVPYLSSVEKPREEVLTGSNGFAFAPKITESGRSILYINPHVTFYFRPEVHMVSEEGLNAYGAVTWGQFFIYQGFNAHCGWMHTSSYVDAADTYAEQVSKMGEHWAYTYEGKKRPIQEKPIVILSKNGNGLDTTKINALYTHHGPIMAKRSGKWLSLKADNRIYDGLVQCWNRTKAKGLADFKKTLNLKGNISNNTVYADAAGNIAYWHGNRIPRRDSTYDWEHAVDGSTAATEWKGYHALEETVSAMNPPNGWLQNCNSTPFTVAGKDSPKRENFPDYMAPDGENFRGINAVRVLGEEQKYTLDKVIKAGYDLRLAAFELLVPALVKAFEQQGAYPDSLFPLLAGPIATLKKWDYKTSETSIATSLAITWGDQIWPAIRATKFAQDPKQDMVAITQHFASTASPKELLEPLVAAVNELETKFGSWKTPWGAINRFQRISSDIDNQFDDEKASLPMAYASSRWGMLPAYISRSFPNTQKRYGEHGNSFICAVEFGPKIKAKSLLAGGESGHVDSKHFFDQGERYTKAQFKDVLFYKEDVMKQVERNYHPGE